MTNDPAFPQPLFKTDERFITPDEYGLGGLTIRAYMATAFAAALASNGNFQVANRAVKLADELIAELSKP